MPGRGGVKRVTNRYMVGGKRDDVAVGLTKRVYTQVWYELARE
jgi:hypothetical protein